MLKEIRKKDEEEERSRDIENTEMRKKKRDNRAGKKVRSRVNFG